MENIFNIVWFKRDLRVSDHLPLFSASKDTVPFIPLYIFEEEYWKQKFSSLRHWSFVHDCLVELDNDLSILGSKGRTIKELRKDHKAKKITYKKRKEYELKQLKEQLLLEISCTHLLEYLNIRMH